MLQKLHLSHHFDEELVHVVVGASGRLEERTRPLLGERLALAARHLTLRHRRAGWRRASREVQLVPNLHACTQEVEISRLYVGVCTHANAPANERHQRIRQRRLQMEY